MSIRRLWILWLSLGLAWAFVSYFWWQWLLPQEDDFGFLRLLMGMAIAGVAGGLTLPATRARRRVHAVVMIVAMLLLPIGARSFIPPAAPLIRTFASAVGLVALFAGALFAAFFDRRWRWPLAAAAVPFVLVIVSTMPPRDLDKSHWPWSTLRPALLRFQADLVAARADLKLPANRALTDAEFKLLASRTPIHIDLSLPLFPLPVAARFVGGDIWVYWGDRTFGPIDPQTMQIQWASD